MNHTSTIAVVLLVSAIFAGSMMHAHAARPLAERSVDMSASRGDADDGANQGSWQISAAATADRDRTARPASSGAAGAQRV